jgi:hypothetical protein
MASNVMSWATDLRADLLQQIENAEAQGFLVAEVNGQADLRDAKLLGVLRGRLALVEKVIVARAG